MFRWDQYDEKYKKKENRELLYILWNLQGGGMKD